MVRGPVPPGALRPGSARLEVVAGSLASAETGRAVAQDWISSRFFRLGCSPVGAGRFVRCAEDRKGSECAPVYGLGVVMIRFAFLGRVSTEDLQNPVASREWQLARAEALVAGRGRIVAEFFDVGQSRAVSWLTASRVGAVVGGVGG